MEELLSLTQTAQLLGVSERSIYRLMETDKLHPFKMGKFWKFERSDIDAYIASERKKSKAEIERKRQVAPTKKLPVVKKKDAA